MTSAPQYELYRVILDYEALQDGFLDRIDDLDTTITGVELVAEMASGQLQKCLSKNPGKAIQRPRDHRSASARRTFGWETLGKTLEKTGLALVLVVDDGRFAPIKEQLLKRRRRSQPANAGSARPTWLFKGKKAREMGKKRFSLMSESERKRHQRKAGKASARARRRKSALVKQPAPNLGDHRVPRLTNLDAGNVAPVADHLPRHTSQ